MNDKAVYRTAPATPGLLNNQINAAFSFVRRHLALSVWDRKCLEQKDQQMNKLNNVKCVCRTASTTPGYTGSVKHRVPLVTHI